MNATMSDEARAAKNKYMREYMRKYRAEHPDRVRANEAAYWEKKARESDFQPQKSTERRKEAS